MPIIGKEQENFSTRKSCEKKENKIKSKKDTRDLCFRARNIGVKKYSKNII